MWKLGTSLKHIMALLAAPSNNGIMDTETTSLTGKAVVQL